MTRWRDESAPVAPGAHSGRGILLLVYFLQGLAAPPGEAAAPAALLAGAAPFSSWLPVALVLGGLLAYLVLRQLRETLLGSALARFAPWRKRRLRGRSFWHRREVRVPWRDVLGRGAQWLDPERGLMEYDGERWTLVEKLDSRLPFRGGVLMSRSVAKCGLVHFRRRDGVVVPALVRCVWGPADTRPTVNLCLLEDRGLDLEAAVLNETSIPHVSATGDKTAPVWGFPDELPLEAVAEPEPEPAPEPAAPAEAAAAATESDSENEADAATESASETAKPT